VYAIFDSNRREFTYVSAGHTPIVHLRRGAEPAFHSSTGQPIALVPADLGRCEYQETTVKLEPGDRLYLMSDGIPEAHQKGREEYGEERAARTLQRCFDLELVASITCLLDDVWDWTGGTGPNDDVSILALEVEG